MIKITFAIVAMLTVMLVGGQHSLQIKIINKETQEPLPFTTVSIRSTEKSITADSAGKAIFENLSSGNFKLLVSHVGFIDETVPVSIPFGGTILEIALQPEEEEEEEV